MTAQSPLPKPGLKAARMRALAGRLHRAQGGTAAVEFALVALPFFALLFGILELGLIFVLSTSLDNATATAARKIRTGQLQLAGTANATQFKTDICANLGWLASDCATNMTVDVSTFATFKDVVLPNALKPDGTLKPDNFSAGDAGSIVLVRVYYQWTLISPLLTKAVARINGKTLVTSTLAFKNEPYS